MSPRLTDEELVGDFTMYLDQFKVALRSIIRAIERGGLRSCSPELLERAATLAERCEVRSRLIYQRRKQHTRS